MVQAKIDQTPTISWANDFNFINHEEEPSETFLDRVTDKLLVCYFPIETVRHILLISLKGYVAFSTTREEFATCGVEYLYNYNTATLQLNTAMFAAMFLVGLGTVTQMLVHGKENYLQCCTTVTYLCLFGVIFTLHIIIFIAYWTEVSPKNSSMFYEEFYSTEGLGAMDCNSTQSFKDKIIIADVMLKIESVFMMVFWMFFVYFILLGIYKEVSVHVVDVK